MNFELHAFPSQVCRSLRSLFPLDGTETVKLEDVVDSLPKVTMFNGHHPAEMLPLPVVFTPLPQTVAESLLHIPAVGHKRHFCPMRNRFEAAEYRQQLTPLRIHPRFTVTDFQTVRLLGCGQQKLPITGRF
jgi:hypothetical protein